MTVVKVALIAFIIIAGLGFGQYHAPAPVAAAPLTAAGFFAALVAALWAYDGWNNVAMVASEVREPAAQSAARVNLGNHGRNYYLFIGECRLFQSPDRAPKSAGARGSRPK